MMRSICNAGARCKPMSIPLVKVDASKREVYGVMAEEAPDKSGEIFDCESSKPYVREWVEEFNRSTDGKSFGNVRSQHGNVAAGKLIGVTSTTRTSASLSSRKSLTTTNGNKCSKASTPASASAEVT